MTGVSPSPVRFREDTGWEFRCASCATRTERRFWPLTAEFWAPERGMLRCLACWRAYDRRQSRERYHAKPEAWRERRRRKQRAYRRAAPAQQRVVNQLRWERIKNDPELLERARARGREAQRRYRARLDAEKRKAA